MASLTPRLDRLENNLIINGNFDFWQRGTSFVSVSGASYKADRWITTEDGGGTCTVSRDTDVPNNKSNYSLLWECTAADATLDAADAYLIEQRIEGNNFQPLLGKNISLSFYVKSNKTGPYSVSFVNQARDRSYTTEFTVDASDVWEKKTITIQHNDAGAWTTDNGVGLRVIFGLGIGSNLNTSNLNTWESGGDVRGSSTATNIQDTVGNQFRIAQVMLNEGEVAGEFSRAGKSIGEELELCHRYYYTDSLEMLFSATSNSSNVTTTAYLFREFPVIMRALPSVSWTGASEFGSGPSLRALSLNSVALIGGSTSGNAPRIQSISADAEL